MDRMQKEALVADMRQRLEASTLVVVARQSGLTVDEVTGLRRDMRAANAEFKVLKNTLAQIAVKGTKLDGLTDMLTGPTTLAYSVDPIAAAKALVTFANKNDKIKVVGACLDGKILNEAEVKALEIWAKEEVIEQVKDAQKDLIAAGNIKDLKLNVSDSEIKVKAELA